MSEIPVIWLPGSNRSADTKTTEALTRYIAGNCEAMASELGWPVVLDSLLSAYLSLALPHLGEARLTEILGKCRKDVGRFAAVVRAQNSEPGGRA